MTNHIVLQDPKKLHAVELDVNLKEEKEVIPTRIENSDSKPDEPDGMDEIVDSKTKFEDEAPPEPIL